MSQIIVTFAMYALLAWVATYAFGQLFIGFYEQALTAYRTIGFGNSAEDHAIEEVAE